MGLAPDARAVSRLAVAVVEHIEIRLHETVLYNSIYRADDRIFVNQHVYGIPAAHSPLFCYCQSASGDTAAAYLDSFEKVWISAEPS